MEEPSPASGELSSKYEPPRDQIEKTLVQLWTCIFANRKIGIHDDFFELGGDSWAAREVLAGIDRLFQQRFDVRELFQLSTIAQIGRAIRTRTTNAQANIDPGESSQGPLSFFQESALLHETAALLSDRSFRQGVSFRCLRVTGTVDVTLLTRAVDEVVRRHQVLRTAFLPIPAALAKGERPFFEMVVADEAPVHIVQINLADLREHERDREITEIVKTAIDMPFHFTKPPLIRCLLLRLAENSHVFVVVISKLGSDLVSLDIFQEELAVLYDAFSEGQRSPLPKMALQYSDFARLQRQRLSARAAELTDYWQRQRQKFPLLDAATLTSLCHRANVTIYPQGEILNLDWEFVKSLREFCRSRRVTLYSAFLAAVGILFFQWCKVQQFGIVGLFSNRAEYLSERLIGPFANAHILGFDLADGMCGMDVLSQTQLTVINAINNQESPSSLQGKRLWASPISKNPRSFIAFNFVHRRTSAQSKYLKIDPFRLPVVPNKRALTISANDRGRDVALEAHGPLFIGSASRIDVAYSVGSILWQLVTSPQQKISELSMTVDQEHWMSS